MISLFIFFMAYPGNTSGDKVIPYKAIYLVMISKKKKKNLAYFSIQLSIILFISFIVDKKKTEIKINVGMTNGTNTDIIDGTSLLSLNMSDYFPFLKLKNRQFVL